MEPRRCGRGKARWFGRDYVTELASTEPRWSHGKLVASASVAPLSTQNYPVNKDYSGLNGPNPEH